MADIKELSAEDLQAKITELTAAKEAAEQKASDLSAAKDAAEQKASQLSESLNAIPNAPKKVAAKFKAMVLEDGKPVKREFGFADGHVWLRFSKPGGIILPTDIVCRVAGGGKATKEEMAKYHDLSQVLTIDGADNGACKAHLQALVDIGFGGLVAAK